MALKGQFSSNAHFIDFSTICHQHFRAVKKQYIPKTLDLRLLIALIAKQNDIHPIPFSSTEISYPGSHQYISKQQNIGQKDFLTCSKQISNSQKLLSPLGNLHFLWRFWLYFSGRKFSHVPRLKLKWLNILAELILHPQVT